MARSKESAMSSETRKRRRKRHHVKQHQSHARHRRRPSWLCTTALVASAAFSAAFPTRVFAGMMPVPSETITWARQAQGSRPAGDQPVRRFDIAPGPLAAVLPVFERAAGITVTLAADSIGMITSPGVAGVFTPQDALAHLLEGTSVAFRFVAANAVTLEFRLTAESVDVSAPALHVAALPKFTQPIRDTPQSIDVITSAVLSDQGATTLRDAVRNVAGISLAAGEAGAQGDNLTIRGFTARNDMFIDGMRDFGSYYRDPFNQEQVQILKGPSSVAFGRGTTGGVLNQATKMPGRDAFANGSATLGTDETRRATLDVNEPVPAFGDAAAFRLNLMATDAHVAGRDVAENRRYGVAPSLALGLGTPTRATFTYLHQAENDVPDYGIPWRFNAPAPVARNNYYGFANGNFLDTRADIAGAKVQHDFGPNISVASQVRYANYGRDVQVTEAQMPAGLTLATPLSAINVNRNQITVDSAETFLQNQFDVTSRFRTGAVGHTLVAGIEAGRETSDPTRTTFASVPNTSLLAPNPLQAFAGTPTVSSRIDAHAVSVGFYALDTVSLGDRWDLMGGARWDRFDAAVSQSVGTATSFTRVDEKPSWRAAVVFKPKPFGSVYVDYGTSFNPSAESLSLSAATVSLPPESNQTIEAGSKWDLASGRLSVRGAVFQTEKLNAREPDPANSLLNVLSGTQRVNGVEGETTGRVTDRWQLMAAYAFMDSHLIKSSAFPAAVGAQLANAPRHTFSLWNTFELPWRFEVGGGGQYVGMRTASTTAPLDPTTGLVKALPGYWVANAMAKRALSGRVDLQINVNNLTNRYYFDLLHPGHIVPGAGRTALVGINFKY